MVASTNAPSVPALAIEQPSPSCHGVARPVALSGLAGTASEQFIEAAARAAGWFLLMAGFVARSPSVWVAIWPLANELAGGTVAVLEGLAVGLAVADALAVAIADGV